MDAHSKLGRKPHHNAGGGKSGSKHRNLTAGLTRTTRAAADALSSATNSIAQAFTATSSNISSTRRAQSENDAAFKGISVLRCCVESPAVFFALAVVAMMAFVVSFTVLAVVRQSSFVSFLWTDVPLQIEDWSIDGGYHRSLGFLAGQAGAQNVALDEAAPVQLQQSIVERQVEVIYHTKEGNILNSFFLEQIFRLESTVRNSTKFKQVLRTLVGFLACMHACLLTYWIVGPQIILAGLVLFVSRTRLIVRWLRVFEELHCLHFVFVVLKR